MVDIVDPKSDKNEKEKPISEMGGAGTSFYRGFGRPDNMKVNLAAEHEDFDFKEKEIPKVEKDEGIKVAPFIPSPEKQEAPASVQNDNRGSIDTSENFQATHEKDIEPNNERREEKTQELPQNLTDAIEVNEDIPMAPVPTSQASNMPKPTMPVKPVKIKEPVNWRGFFIVFGTGLSIAVVAGLISFFGFGYYYDDKIGSQESELEALKKQESTLVAVPALLEPAQPVVQPENTAPTPKPTPAVVTPEPIEEEKPTTPTGGSG